MRIAGTPRWCVRQSNGAYPEFRAWQDGADTIVASVNNAPFTPAFAPGDHGGFVDFALDPAFGGYWCRRFKGAGEPGGYSDMDDGAYILNTDHGTYDIARKG